MRSILYALIAFSLIASGSSLMASFGGTSSGSSGSGPQQPTTGQPGGGMDIYQSNRQKQTTTGNKQKSLKQRPLQGNSYLNRYPYQSWQDRDARE